MPAEKIAINCWPGRPVMESNASLTPVGKYIGYVGGRHIIAALLDAALPFSTISEDNPLIPNGTPGSTLIEMPPTDAIVISTIAASNNPNYPALKHCYDMQPTGVWRMPYGAELRVMYENRHTLGLTENIGYFSFSEMDPPPESWTRALVFVFGYIDGHWAGVGKSSTYRTRCIRSF